MITESIDNRAITIPKDVNKTDKELFKLLDFLLSKKCKRDHS